MTALRRSLNAVSEAAQQRALLDEAFARDPGAFAEAVEEIFTRAAAGEGRGRDASLAVASWIAACLARGDRERLARVHEEGTARALASVSNVFDPGAPQRALARRGRLAEVCVPARARIGVVRWCCPKLADEDLAPDPLDDEDERVEAPHISSPIVELTDGQKVRWVAANRGREHHDPVFIRRLLDTPWLRARDVIVIAARRPTTSAIALAIATRDRWLQQPRVRLALALNPFTPVALARALRCGVPAPH